ncbi:MAG: response regulator [Candidatus Omnitrophota bacterium]
MFKKSKEKKFYTTYEAGDMLFVSHSTIIEWINAGRIKAVKTLGGHRRIPKEELNTFMKRNGFHLPKKDPSRILIVDDDESIRIGLKELLEEQGFKVDAVSDGFEAGVLAIHTEPSLIILDLKMQGLDGFSACRLIKTNPLLKNIKILVLTGYPSEENLNRIQKLGADRCLAKPAENKILLDEIHSLLGVEKSKNK